MILPGTNFLTKEAHEFLYLALIHGINFHRILCGLILFLCLVGTILDIAFDFMKPHPKPVNKSDSFMPVRGVSMATDDNETPHRLVHSDTNSENTNLLHTSPEVTFSASPTLPREPAKPSKGHVNH